MSRSARGFTLLELLVALAIFALAAGALLKVLGEQGRHAAQLEQRYFAALAAQNHLSTLYLQPAWPELGERQREITLAGDTFTLEEEVTTTDDPGLRRVRVRVRVSHGTQPLVERQAFLGPTP